MKKKKRKKERKRGGDLLHMVTKRWEKNNFRSTGVSLV